MRLTLWDSKDCYTPGFPPFTVSQSLLKLMSVELVMPSNHFILCHLLLLLPSIFLSNVSPFFPFFEISFCCLLMEGFLNSWDPLLRVYHFSAVKRLSCWGFGDRWSQTDKAASCAYLKKLAECRALGHSVRYWCNLYQDFGALNQ